MSLFQVRRHRNSNSRRLVSAPGCTAGVKRAGHRVMKAAILAALPKPEHVLNQMLKSLKLEPNRAM
eukprot:5235490-Amphidinium_carterae.2